MLVPDYTAQPQKRPRLLLHGSVFILTFSILACLVAGYLVRIAMASWSLQGLSKEGHLLAIAGGVLMLGISLLLLAIAIVVIVTAPARLRLWQHLMLLVPAALAALMSGFTILVAK